LRVPGCERLSVAIATVQGGLRLRAGKFCARSRGGRETATFDCTGPGYDLSSRELGQAAPAM